MNNKEKRMKTMSNAGINTGKYFSFKLTEGLRPGASITLVIGEDGTPVMMDNTKSTACDLVKEEIFANGYVKNTKLHRRWVMAHMFRMLNFTSDNGYEKGYDAAMRYWHGYDYQFKVLADEIKALAKLEASDYECFIERSSFFNKDVVIDTCMDYMEKLKEYIDGLKIRHCKGVPYKRIKGKDVFVEDIAKKIYRPMRLQILKMKHAKTYLELQRHFRSFMVGYVDLPYKTPKCKVWKDAFKGAGAFYTLKNMIMYHNCHILCPTTGVFMSTKASLEWIQAKRNEYRGEGWRMFGLMKKVIKDNNFDFDKRMKEIYE